MLPGLQVTWANPLETIPFTNPPGRLEIFCGGCPRPQVRRYTWLPYSRLIQVDQIANGTEETSQVLLLRERVLLTLCQIIKSDVTPTLWFLSLAIWCGDSAISHQLRGWTRVWNRIIIGRKTDKKLSRWLVESVPDSKWDKGVLVCLCVRCVYYLFLYVKCSVNVFVYGHSTEKAPVLVRSPQLSSVAPG